VSSRLDMTGYRRTIH